MNEIMLFNSEEFGQIRTIENEDGTVLFFATDVANVLGYKNPHDAILKHCKGVAKREVPHPQSKTKTLEVNVISNNDVIRLVTHSEMTKAQEIESWIFDEVIPTILKTGKYEMPNKIKSDDRIKVQEMNARTRMANMYLKIAKEADTMSKEYKNILYSKSAEVLAGEMILPLPKTNSEHKTLSATELGNIFGITANKIGRIANDYGLKTEEYGEFYRDKSRHSGKEVDSFRYYDGAIIKFEEILGQKNSLQSDQR